MQSLEPLEPSNNQPLNPKDFEITELPAATPTSLEVRRKPAGKASVKTNKVKPQPKKKVITPGLGKVTLVTH
jgi:predicted secreted protein